MNIIYNFSLRLLFAVMALLGRVNHKAHLFVSGRKGLLDKIRSEVKSDSPIVWVHCASVGEFEQGRPLIELYKQKHPENKILLTFFSPSGYELRKNYPLADWVYYMPIDIKRNSVAFLDAVHPSMALFIKYEYWFNYLYELKSRNIPTYVVSAIFMPRQRFFSWYGTIFRKMLRCFTHIFVQDDLSKRLLRGIGIHNVTVSGDTRFDRVKMIAEAGRDIEQIALFSQGSKCWVAGSTWPADEKIISGILPSLPDCKLIIAPHEVGKKHIEDVVNHFSGYKVVKYSDVMGTKVDVATESALRDANVLVIDTIGILSSVYRYSSFAYIGGGFGAGIHNILEAATYGVPVIFGPKFRRFKEAVDLVKRGGAQNITGATDMKIWVEKYLEDSETRLKRGKICLGYIEKNLGATQRVLDGIAAISSSTNRL